MHSGGINWVPKDDFPLKSTKKTKESKHASLFQGIFVNWNKIKDLFGIAMFKKRYTLTKWT